MNPPAAGAVARVGFSANAGSSSVGAAISVEPLNARARLPTALSRLNIRIGTKSVAYWPQRFVSDKDSDDLMRLFEKVVASGKNLAIMGHYNHAVELRAPIAQQAVKRKAAVSMDARSTAAAKGGPAQAPAPGEPRLCEGGGGSGVLPCQLLGVKGLRGEAGYGGDLPTVLARARWAGHAGAPSTSSSRVPRTRAE